MKLFHEFLELTGAIVWILALIALVICAPAAWKLARDNEKRDTEELRRRFAMEGRS